MIVAVDFDGTLCHSEYPAADILDMRGINILRAFRKRGGKLILWTCRHDKALEDAIIACRNAGLEFDAVNENEQEHIEHWKKESGEDNATFSPKVFADFYIDDCSLIDDDKIPWDKIEKKLANC